MKANHLIFPMVALVCNVSAAAPNKPDISTEFAKVTKALFTSDIETLLKHAPPKFKIHCGGEEKYKRIITAACQYMKEANIKFVSAKVDKLTDLAKSKDEEYFFISTTMVLLANEKEISTKETYLVVRTGVAAPWCYMKVAPKQLVLLEQLYPDIDFSKAPKETTK